MTLDYDLVSGPLGRTLIAATPLGLCAVAFGDSDAALLKDLKRRFPRAELRRKGRLFRFVGAALKRWLTGSAPQRTAN